ncbi:class I SAM-dependent methyltransferase [Candidatus Omnitrophota bacterium]
MDTAGKVKEANRMIYDKLSGEYEALDGRRTPGLSAWVRKSLNDISAMVDQADTLLDIGSGSGFVARQAKDIFSKSYGIDISENILKDLNEHGVIGLCADGQKLPFKEKSIDVVSLFSVIHHFYDYRPVLDEAYRVLKKGGVIYIDHDMNRTFFKNFRPFISIYRRLSAKEKILRERGIEELHALSEYHSEGIEFEQVRDYLISLGFNIEKSYCHWYGLSPITDFIFRNARFSKGLAPLAGFIAKKIND